MTSISPPIAAVAFDLGNVLVKVDHLRFCRGLAELAGWPPQEIYAAVFHSGLEPGYDRGRLSSREFHRRLQARFRLDLPFPRFRDLWNEIFDPLEDMQEVVARLARRYPSICSPTPIPCTSVTSGSALPRCSSISGP